MNIIWTLLLLVMSMGNGGVQPAADQAAGNGRPESILPAVVQTMAANLAAGRIDDPLTPAEVKAASLGEAPKVKGIYVTAYSAGGSRMNELVDLVDKTELNAMVIDIKDDSGYITYKTENPELNKLGKAQPFIRDIGALMERLEKHDIYPIARIVVFKDTILAKKHPEYSFVQKDGSVWSNGGGDSFVNPYSKEVWDYNIEIAKEAAKLGFKEIQFDYVRFPEGFEKRADSLNYEKSEMSRVDAVSSFVKYAKEQLEPLGIRVSVDIFGYAASVPAAEGIGQDFVKISDQVNIICPMIYPSHYSTGWFNAKDPDKAPYQTIKGAIKDTQDKLAPLGEEQPIVRPWIQDFTASWLGKGHYIKYGKHEVEEQIRALRDMNVDEYLLWNASNRYTEGVSYK
ncbi:putative glycoside hydrolase [Paenibacillus macerans]|uniref:putative glycoside hydrolase n=1 Tax=Paenibacillus TaxID=44249 RepID=UPI00097A2BBE|nr:putative glycoside hydrolase [Paenibacillus macerans]MBS5911192.1 putative glycoside hydrolase [Paenibacillus macerans]MDU5948075.1 putative glycoside hydrolase [Paenibacillus macerans]MEC0138251.1 putative glycoside hydrolase [Paenibacillus macerans]OMG50741.1 GTP-binding protein [Paenibacillus macerans]UMV44999.1 putative glycoside hydrolase [Paenibacillus macerans]